MLVVASKRDIKVSTPVEPRFFFFMCGECRNLEDTRF